MNSKLREKITEAIEVTCKKNKWRYSAEIVPEVLARAIFKALETPAPEMIEAGGKFLSDQWEGDNWSDPDKRTRWCFEAEDCFTAMIAAAQEQGDA